MAPLIWVAPFGEVVCHGCFGFMYSAFAICRAFAARFRSLMSGCGDGVRVYASGAVGWGKVAAP